MIVHVVTDPTRLRKAGLSQNGIAVITDEGAAFLAPACINHCKTPAIMLSVVECTDLPVEDVHPKMTAAEQDRFLAEFEQAQGMGQSLTYTAVERAPSEAWEHAAAFLAQLATSARCRANELRIAEANGK